MSAEETTPNPTPATSAEETKEEVEPIKEKHNYDFKYENDCLTFFPENQNGKKWNFQQIKKKKKWFGSGGGGGIEFFIDGESKGKVTSITISYDDSIEIVVGTETFVTKPEDPEENELLRTHLRKLCAKEKRILREYRMMALMLAAMNGRNNFDLYSPLMKRECPENCEEITREKLLKILRRENEMRLSKEMLELLEEDACAFENESENDTNTCNTVGHVYIPWAIEKFQEKVAKEFGYKSEEEMSYALQMLRSARSLFPNDEEINNATFYLKYNRSRLGELKVGDTFKDVPLMNCCGGEEKRLSDLLYGNGNGNGNKITVVVSGSIT